MPLTRPPASPYRWLVTDPDLLGGQLAVRGTRLSVAFVLSCLSQGMSLDEIRESYDEVPAAALPEILQAAAEALTPANVAA